MLARLCSLAALAPLALLLAEIPSAAGSALTTAIGASDRACFFANVDKKGEKIGFYFAVQAGGSFDIDFDVHSPSDKLILTGDQERQGDYIFTGNEIGEYSFCFSNRMSTFAEKLVDFDIMVESEPRHELPKQGKALKEHTNSLEDSIYKISGQLSSIQRTQRYFRTRENRGVATVQSTQSRMFWFGTLESLAMVAMACAQVWVVKNFFNHSSRRYKV